MCQSLGPKKHDEISEIDCTWITVVILELIHAPKPDFFEGLCCLSKATCLKSTMRVYIYIYMCIERERYMTYTLHMHEAAPDEATA